MGHILLCCAVASDNVKYACTSILKQRLTGNAKAAGESQSPSFHKREVTGHGRPARREASAARVCGGPASEAHRQPALSRTTYAQGIYLHRYVHENLGSCIYIWASLKYPERTGILLDRCFCPQTHAVIHLTQPFFFLRKTEIQSCKCTEHNEGRKIIGV